MIDIIDPKLVTSEVSEDRRYGKFVWEPLERGYGITLGNSLRRVLLHRYHVERRCLYAAGHRSEKL